MERLAEPEVRVDDQPDHIRRQRGKRVGKSTDVDMVKHKSVGCSLRNNESLPTGVELKRARTCKGGDGPYIRHLLLSCASNHGRFSACWPLEVFNID